MVSLSELSHAVSGLSVEPPRPAWAVFSAPEVEETIAQVTRDGSSSWAGFIRYVDSSGATSERRIICRSVDGYGRADTITAICCEKRASRSFRIDRIQELICLESGEVLDPMAHFEQLRLHGALKVMDKALTDFGRILVFVSKCDGTMHPLEMEEVTDALGRYVLRIGGDDRTLEAAVKNIRKIAPDDIDLVEALGRLERHPEAKQVSRLILDSVNRVVAADGDLHADELAWSRTIEEFLLGIYARA